jgi:hypothetical protein
MEIITVLRVGTMSYRHSTLPSAPFHLATVQYLDGLERIKHSANVCWIAFPQ